MLHRFRAKVDAQLFELTGFAVLKTEHVQDAYKAVRGMAKGMVEQGH